MSENKNIKISDLVLNTGQIEGLPKNPRFIRNERFESLKKSIQDAPEMLDYRRLAVYPFNGKYVILCGNMRFRACKELGYKELPCYVLPTETPAKVLREWVVKDNVAFGEIDAELLAEWDATELQEWGMELPSSFADEDEKEEERGQIKFSNEIDKENNYIVLAMRTDIDWINAKSIFELESTASKTTTGNLPKGGGIGVGRVLDYNKAIELLKKNLL